MCVAITLEPGGQLTLEEVTRMDRANADGVGVAWAGDGLVHWSKTTKVDPQSVLSFINGRSDVPRLAHFRFATAGGTRTELCHPFEVGPQATCTTSGSGQKVMIHNGHWGRWNEVYSLLDKEGLLPDAGSWSDSRLAAFLAHLDEEWLGALGGRVATMNADGDIVRMGDWAELRTGIYVSNKHWDVQNSARRGGYAGYRSWKGWDSDDTSASCEVGKGHGKTQDKRTPPDKPGAEASAKGQKGSAQGGSNGTRIVGAGAVRSSDPYVTKDGRVFTYDPATGHVVETPAKGS